MQVAEDWADVRVGGVGGGHIVRRRVTQAVASENCVDRLLLDNGATRQREIGPWGHCKYRGREWNLRISQGNCGGDREATSCRLTSESDAFRTATPTEEPLVGGPSSSTAAGNGFSGAQA